MAGWPPRRESAGEESPGFTGIWHRVTPGGGNPRESATESKPPAHAERRLRARVKGCGKSAPRSRQRGWHGKPCQKQDRIGTADVKQASTRIPACRPGRLLEVPGNRHPRGMVIHRGESRGDKTRLTGHLAPPPSFFPLRFLSGKSGTYKEHPPYPY